MDNIKINAEIISEIKDIILERFNRMITPQITDVKILNKVNRKRSKLF